MAIVAATTEIHAAEPHISRESIEWCNICIPEYLRQEWAERMALEGAMHHEYTFAILSGGESIRLFVRGAHRVV